MTKLLTNLGWVRVILIILISGFLLLFLANKLPTILDATKPATLKFPNGKAISLLFANTADEWSQGLSGRLSLSTDEGMLFIFPQEDFYPFWMPNMNFSIDIIWISEAFKIVDIKKNVPPVVNGQFPIAQYINSHPARYVLEINAGLANLNHLKVGDKLTWRQK
ncbi:DUF192 domain-containing protein [Patescibacteria group bacterium]|nr:DUF192 domain-containing protein [Patescibacteria group bacterium]